MEWQVVKRVVGVLRLALRKEGATICLHGSSKQPQEAEVVVSAGAIWISRSFPRRGFPCVTLLAVTWRTLEIQEGAGSNINSSWNEGVNNVRFFSLGGHLGRFSHGAKGPVSEQRVEGSSSSYMKIRHWLIEYFIKCSTYHSFPTQTPQIIFKKCRGKLRQWR